MITSYSYTKVSATKWHPIFSSYYWGNNYEHRLSSACNYLASYLRSNHFKDKIFMKFFGFLLTNPASRLIVVLYYGYSADFMFIDDTHVTILTLDHKVFTCVIIAQSS